MYVRYAEPNMSRNDDPAYAYIDADTSFRGKKLIVAGIVPWSLYWLSAQVVQWDQMPRAIGLSLSGILAVSSLIYLVGYWQGIKAKGYPGILFVASFTGIIGVIVLLFLPDRSGEIEARGSVSEP